MFGYILDSRPTQEEGEPFRWRYTRFYFIQYQPNDVWGDPWFQIRNHLIRVRDEDEISEADTEMNAETLYLNEFSHDQADFNNQTATENLWGMLGGDFDFETDYDDREDERAGYEEQPVDTDDETDEDIQEHNWWSGRNWWRDDYVDESD